MAPVFGMMVNDYDANGTLDALLIGNSYSSEVSTGNYDASFGLLILGQGDGTWKTMGLRHSGFVSSGDAKSMVSLPYKNKSLVLVANNNGTLNVFEQLHPKSLNADKHNPKVELYLGSGYLSQSAIVEN
jgi:hypothetical protein